VSKAVSEATVQERLEFAIVEGLLPDAVANSAMLILGRLEGPLRIALLGMPQSGKSTVLNLLAGQNVIPENTQKLPTLLVETGPVSQMDCILPGGNRTLVPGTDLAGLKELNPQFISLETDLPALSKISLLEVALPDTLIEQRKAINWACKRIDVVIWCTTEFSEQEQDLWFEVPDHLMDHGLLLMTKTDILSGKADIKNRITSLKSSFNEDFLRIAPLSAKSALDVRDAEGKLDLAAFKATGATVLISEIKALIESGYREAEGHGRHILTKYCGHIDFSELEYADDADLEETETASKDIPTKSAEKSKPAENQNLSSLDREMLDKSLAKIKDCEASLTNLFQQTDELSVDQVLDICEETIDGVAVILKGAEQPLIAEIRSRAFEIQDSIVLMKSEQDESCADNAVTLALQLRRDIETVLAV